MTQSDSEMTHKVVVRKISRNKKLRFKEHRGSSDNVEYNSDTGTSSRYLQCLATEPGSTIEHNRSHGTRVLFDTDTVVTKLK